jgi:hypothetical protein
MMTASLIFLVIGVALVFYGTAIEPIVQPRLVGVRPPARYRDQISVERAASIGVSRLRGGS